MSTTTIWDVLNTEVQKIPLDKPASEWERTKAATRIDQQAVLRRWCAVGPVA